MVCTRRDHLLRKPPIDDYCHSYTRRSARGQHHSGRQDTHPARSTSFVRSLAPTLVRKPDEEGLSTSPRSSVPSNLWNLFSKSAQHQQLPIPTYFDVENCPVRGSPHLAEGHHAFRPTNATCSPWRAYCPITSSGFLPKNRLSTPDPWISAPGLPSWRLSA